MSHRADRPALSKARMLAQAAGLLKTAHVLPMDIFTVTDWNRDAAGVKRRICANQWAANRLAVRSSALCEDRPGSSSAGRYSSMLRVRSDELGSAIQNVIASYGEFATGDAEIFVQPMLEDAVASGAATSFDPSGGGRYRIITWADGPATEAVTSGRVGNLHNWQGVDFANGWSDHPIVGRVLTCIREVEQALSLEAFEIEFGIDAEGHLVLFQVRELDSSALVSVTSFNAALNQATVQVDAASARDARILGSGILLAAMSDWNPAELIGIRPMPLAHSLYRELVTDRAWSERRGEYGYLDLRNLPLMIDVAGHALIDVRSSITSLIPAQLPFDVAARLAESCSQRLRNYPTLHDKVEFEVGVTCMSFDAHERLNSYLGYSLQDSDIPVIEASLRKLTDQLCRQDLILKEMRIVSQLTALRENAAKLPPLQSFLKLLRDALSCGTIPFGGLARCSFIATQILQSAVSGGILAPDELDRFYSALSLPSKQLRIDLEHLTRPEFLALYGHLRPGTYDIRLPRYDEAPDRYIIDDKVVPTQVPETSSGMDDHSQVALSHGLKAIGLNLDARSFLSFAKAAIEAREWAKFEFSHSVSDALQVLTEWGRMNGLETSDLCYLSFEDVEKVAFLSEGAALTLLKESASEGASKMLATRAINLPILIRHNSECFGFESIAHQPNFITGLRSVARVADIDKNEDPAGAIVMVQNADPGYDWLFTRGIAGLITAFGGANSHLAVRALENGIPAAIGCGSLTYAHLARFRIVELDAGARQLRGIA